MATAGVSARVRVVDRSRADLLDAKAQASVTRTVHALHVFDMDGTLLPGTTASLQIARTHGGEDWLHSLEVDFRHGLLDTRQFAAALYRGWTALTATQVADAFTHAPKLAGITRAVDDLHAHGEVAVVLSMSPGFFVERWLDYGFDEAIGSRFPMPPFTSELDPADNILTFDDKPQIVERLRTRHGVPADRVVVYGDSQSDVPLFRVAGVSIAVNADDHVRHLATHAYNGPDLNEAYQLARAELDRPAAHGTTNGEPTLRDELSP